MGLPTVADVVSIESLEIRVLAGAAGLNRQVVWSHSCELPNPTRWLGADELLMTVGVAVPQDTAGQIEYIQDLADSDLAGLLLGDHETLPKISNEMLSTANALDFPVLIVPWYIPFSAVSRHIASMSSNEQTMQVLAIAKLYGFTTIGDEQSQIFTEKVTRLFKIGVKIQDVESGIILLESTPKTVGIDAQTSKNVYALNTKRPTTLTITENIPQLLSSMVFVHIKNIFEVEVDRLLNSVDTKVDRGMIAIQDLASKENPSKCVEILGTSKTENLQIVVFPEAAAAMLTRVALWQHLLAVVGNYKQYGVALLPVRMVESFREMLQQYDLKGGASTEFLGVSSHLGAFSEAVNAYEVAVRTNNSWQEYQGVEVLVLSRSRDEISRIAAEVLGPLNEQTPRTDTLRETLFTYLENDRSWAESAKMLGIHRQTLAYRLRQIEELTQRSTSKAADLAVFWIAVEAWKQLKQQQSLILESEVE